MDKFPDDKNLNIQQWSYDLDQETKKVGFYWTSTNEILDKINSEVMEIRDAIAGHESKTRVSEEIGDLYLCVVNLCHYLDLNPDLILQNSLKKFQKRFDFVKEAMKKRDINHFDSGSLNIALGLWNEAKEKENGAAEED